MIVFNIFQKLIRISQTQSSMMEQGFIYTDVAMTVLFNYSIFIILFILVFKSHMECIII